MINSSSYSRFDSLYSDSTKAINPGSKILSIGLDKHNPVEALETLLNDEKALSVALHELTHFHSLTNDIGSVLTCLGFYVFKTWEDLIQRVERKLPDTENSLIRFLKIRADYLRMLEAWRPFLEGLAVFAQTNYPCSGIDEQLMPVDTLTFFGAALYSLSPTPSTRLFNSLDSILENFTLGLQGATNRTLIRGPQLTVEGIPLAASLELCSTSWSLPYFLGNSYIRGVQARVRRVLPKYDCPELFLNLMMQIVQGSARLLLEQDAQWNTPKDIDRVYGWIELLDNIPKERIEYLPQLGQDIDPLYWLRNGQLVPRIRTSSHDIGNLFSQVIPSNWNYFMSIESTDDKKIIELGLAGTIGETFTIKLSSGGECKVVGLIPNAAKKNHYLALNVSDHIWWLALNDDELETLKLQKSALQELSINEFRPYKDIKLPSKTQLLNVSCFLTQLGFGLEQYSHEGNHHFLFEFSSPDSQENTLLTHIVPERGRSILQTCPDITKQSHDAGVYFKKNIKLSLKPALVMERYLLKNGYSELAKKTKKWFEKEKCVRERQADLWSMRILEGLLGHQKAAETLTIIKKQRLSDNIYMNIENVKEALVAAYSVPIECSGPAQLDTEFLLEEINEWALTVFGKPLFKRDNMNRVRYVGLWDR